MRVPARHVPQAAKPESTKPKAPDRKPEAEKKLEAPKPPPPKEVKTSPRPTSEISGGVDAKVQFEASQHLNRNKNPQPKANDTRDERRAGSAPGTESSEDHAGHTHSNEAAAGRSPAKGNVPDSQDENGLTAKQLNTTGSAPAVTNAELSKAANGDQKIVSLLQKMDQDAEGHKALRTALDKGTTYKQGNLDGNVIGLTQYGGNRGPVITLESMSLDTAAHETAHAAYQDMSHAEVYRFGHRVEDRLKGAGITPESAPVSLQPGAANAPIETPQPASTDRPNPFTNTLPSGQKGNGQGSGENFRGGGNSPGGAGNSRGAGRSEGTRSANIPDSKDENGLTAAQLNTTGTSAPVTLAEITAAANGDPEIIALLQKMMQDPEGLKALRLAIDKGTTFKQGELDGNVIGLTQYGGNKGPVITLESMSIDTAAHETAHAAYPDMSHAEVYRFGQRVQANLAA